MKMPVDRTMLRQALRELVRLESGAANPTRFPARLYTSALAEWAEQLGVDPHKLNKLVIVRKAVSGHRPHGV
jgi:hypothetical protein